MNKPSAIVLAIALMSSFSAMAAPCNLFFSGDHIVLGGAGGMDIADDNLAEEVSKVVARSGSKLVDAADQADHVIYMVDSAETIKTLFGARKKTTSVWLALDTKKVADDSVRGSISKVLSTTDLVNHYMSDPTTHREKISSCRSGLDEGCTTHLSSSGLKALLTDIGCVSTPDSQK